MKLFKKLVGKKQQKTRTRDMYQNVVEQFGRDQLLRLAEKGLSISLGAV